MNEYINKTNKINKTNNKQIRPINEKTDKIL